jgi:hypothetical protein
LSFPSNISIYRLLIASTINTHPKKSTEYFVKLATHVVHHGCKSYCIINATTANFVAASTVVVCLSTTTTGAAQTPTNTIANKGSLILQVKKNRRGDVVTPASAGGEQFKLANGFSALSVDTVQWIGKVALTLSDE